MAFAASGQSVLVCGGAKMFKAVRTLTWQSRKLVICGDALHSSARHSKSEFVRLRWKLKCKQNWKVYSRKLDLWNFKIRARWQLRVLHAQWATSSPLVYSPSNKLTLPALQDIYLDYTFTAGLLPFAHADHTLYLCYVKCQLVHMFTRR